MDGFLRDFLQEVQKASATSDHTEGRTGHIKGIRTNLYLVQLPVRRDRLNSGDVFILVCGEDKVWLWIRSDANADERVKGSEVATAFCKGGDVTVLDQGSNDGEVEAASGGTSRAK